MTLNRIKSIVVVLLSVALYSCNAFNEPAMPVPLDEAMENTGVKLQFISIETFDLIDGDDAHMNIQLHLIDNMGGENIKRVDLYLYSMTVKGGEYTLNLTDDPVKLFELSTGLLHATEDGLHGTYTIPLIKVNENLPVEVTFDDIMEHDSYGFQWRIELNNGLTVTEKCGAGISGGVYRPYTFCSSVQVIKSLPEELFTGEYQFTQLNPGSLGPELGVPQVYSAMQFNAELIVDPANSINGRVFQEAYLDYFGASPHDNQIIFATANDTENNSVTLEGLFNSGFSCDDGTALYLAPEGEQLSQFELDDDSSFTMVIRENPEGACGGTPVDVIFEVVKQ